MILLALDQSPLTSDGLEQLLGDADDVTAGWLDDCLTLLCLTNALM